MAIRVMIVVLTSLLTGACSVVGVRSGTEQPDYAVVDTLSESIEVRRYPPQVVAEAVVEAEDPSAGRNRAFGLLFNYISGANRSDTDVAMTAPVEVESGTKIAMTVPVESSASQGRIAMRFILPSSFTIESAPRPTDQRITIKESEPRELAVLRWAGSTSPETVDERLAELRRQLDQAQWQPAGEGYAMFYDPPWTLPFLRRNEVALPVSSG